MNDREKVIRGLEQHLYDVFAQCEECPYQGGIDCKDELLKDALELLEKQEGENNG